MMGDMVVDEACDEEIAVIIAFLPAQGQALAALLDEIAFGACEARKPGPETAATPFGSIFALKITAPVPVAMPHPMAQMVPKGTYQRKAGSSKLLSLREWSVPALASARRSSIARIPIWRCWLTLCS